MNKNQKKALYESIMKSVSRTVKRKLNEKEDYKNNHEMEQLLSVINDVEEPDVKENIIEAIQMLVRDFQGDVSDFNDGNMSYEEINK